MREFDFTEPDRWPATVKALCCVAGAVCALAIGNALVLTDLRAEAAGARHQNESLQAEHERSGAAAERLDAESAARDRAATTFATLLRRLPERIETPRVVNDISRTAVARNLLLVDISLAEKRETALTVEQPISITLVGDYHALGAFAGDLARLVAPVTLHGFQIQPAHAPGKLVMTVVAKTYRYAGGKALAARARSKPSGAPLPPAFGAAPAAYDAADMPDPFQSRSSVALPDTAPGNGPGGTRVRQPLERHPLAQLLLVGTLAANGVRHALVRAPDGGIHRLAEGDYLGRDHGRIRAVHDTFVELVELVRDSGGRWQRRPRTVAMDAAGNDGANNQRRQP